jgi:chemotaxis protein MotB
MIGSEAQTVQTVVKNYAIQKGLESGLQVESAANGLGLQIPGSLAFEAGRASLISSPQTTDVLDLLVKEAIDWVKNVPGGTIRVEGNTDATPVSGPFYADNWELSAARAMTVLHYLRDNGVDPTVLSMQGNGSTMPKAGTLATSADNRRVVVWLLGPDTTPTASPTPAVESIAPSLNPVFGG